MVPCTDKLENKLQILNRRETERLVRFLCTRNPFSKDNTSLRSIVLGVVAHKSVNVDRRHRAEDP